jgi:hypothetical protein
VKSAKIVKSSIKCQEYISFRDYWGRTIYFDFDTKKILQIDEFVRNIGRFKRYGNCTYQSELINVKRDFISLLT